MLEIYLLEQICAFRKYGTLRKAAEELHMSQPSLTRSMQKIESILNTEILSRRGNRVSLNEYGEVVADYAEMILAQEHALTHQIDVMKRQQNTLSLGSVAPGPFYKLLPLASQVCLGCTITSRCADEAELLAGLSAREFSIILLDHPLQDDSLVCREYLTERLYISVNPMHPAAAMKSVSFHDMNGQNFIMYHDVGIWGDIVRQGMPDSRFYEQTSHEAVSDLIRYSDLPSFVTNVTLETIPDRRTNRVSVPFSDDAAAVTFYTICRRDEYQKWEMLYSRFV